MKHYFDTSGKLFWLKREGIVYEECEFDKHEDHDKELKTAMAFIKFSCRKLHGASKSDSSYGLKHSAEKWGERFNEFLGTDIFSPYISNGVFILAAKECSLNIYPIKGTYNCYFNIRKV